MTKKTAKSETVHANYCKFTIDVRQSWVVLRWAVFTWFPVLFFILVSHSAKKQKFCIFELFTSMDIKIVEIKEELDVLKNHIDIFSKQLYEQGLQSTEEIEFWPLFTAAFAIICCSNLELQASRERVLNKLFAMQKYLRNSKNEDFCEFSGLDYSNMERSLNKIVTLVAMAVQVGLRGEETVKEST